MDKKKSKKVIELMGKMQLKIETAINQVTKLEEEYKALQKKTLELLSDEIPFEQPVVSRNKKVEHEYEYKGIADYANRLVLKTTEELAQRFNFDELCSIVDQQEIYPTKWGKLRLYAKEQDVRTLRKDPERRYFMKNPVVSKDGVRFFVTTQWTTRQWNKKQAKEEQGTFERYREAVSKVGIVIKPVAQQ